MTINKKMQDAFNAQIEKELWSSNLYLEMAFWFRSNGWKGFATWMFRQSEEEREHALEMANYVLSRGGKANVTEIKAVPTDFKNPQEVFEMTYKHEQEVTNLINKLADVADEEKDRASANLLSKFIDEQVEEESCVKEILDFFVNNQGHGIGMLDHRLGKQQ